MLAFSVLLVAFLYLGRDVLIPLVVSALVALLLSPAVARLERRVGRVIAVCIVTAISTAGVIAVVWAGARQIEVVVTQLPAYRESIRDKIHALGRSLGSVERARAEAARLIDQGVEVPAPQPAAPRAGASIPGAAAPGVAPPQSAPIAVRLYQEPVPVLQFVASHAQTIGGPVLRAGLVVVLVLFMLLGRDEWGSKALALAGRACGSRGREALDEGLRRIGRYVLAQSAVNGMFGVLAALGLWTIHMTIGGRASVSASIIAGLFCGVLRFVPFVGVWIGAALPVVYTFAVYPGNAVCVVTLGLFVGLEMFTGQFAEPNILGRSVGVSPLALLVATAFWTWLWGPAGLLLSTPLTVIALVASKYIPGWGVLYDLLASARESRPPPALSALATSPAPAQSFGEQAAQRRRSLPGTNLP
jgi:predicted PurR-regulated permease PerM